MSFDASFPSIFQEVKPFIPLSTINPYTLFPSSRFLAHTITTSAIEPFPIQVLFPLMTQPPQTLLAVVSKPTASLPLFGSVKAYAINFSNFIAFGRNFYFYSSVPKRLRVDIPRILSASRKIERPVSNLANSYMRRRESIIEKPAEPYP